MANAEEPRTPVKKLSVALLCFTRLIGANRRGDCKMLAMEIRQGELAKLVNVRLNVAKIDTGRNGNNTDLIAKYGKITRKDVFVLVLLDSAGKVEYQANGGELADARRIGNKGIAWFFFTAILHQTKPCPELWRRQAQ